ncbi:MAG: DUF551 domain-containing protein [Lachnospiraceae bacterium]|nr:DUF551 domain-containing protein [Lachnospiraceae bacterium]
MTAKKKVLVDQIMYLEHNNNVLHNTLNQQAENFNALQQQMWTPVSERLPEIRESVLITLWDYTVTVGQWYGHRWGHAKAYHEDVLAWMPLPVSYSPQNKEKKETPGAATPRESR